MLITSPPKPPLTSPGCAALHLLRRAPPREGAQAPPEEARSQALRPSPPEPWLCCAVCRTPITPENARTQVEGQHEHAFANPHGFLYGVGCFTEAPGCQLYGQETDRWTWFVGYRWAIATCRGCQEHLGWRYRSDAPRSFFGLILSRLVLGEPGASTR